MQGKWAFFAMGVMVGIIALLGSALILQTRDVQAAPSAAQEGMFGNIVMSPGGSNDNRQDICWILRKGEKKAGADTGDKDSSLPNAGEALTLCCYQVKNGGDGIKLVGVRDIRYDMQLLELKNEKPTVVDIVKFLREAEKNRKKDEK